MRRDKCKLHLWKFKLFVHILVHRIIYWLVVRRYGNQEFVGNAGSIVPLRRTPSSPRNDSSLHSPSSGLEHQTQKEVDVELRSLQRLRAKRLIPLAVIAVVALLIIVSASNTVNQRSSAFAFRVYWPPPSTYVPGSTPPAAYLEINYTGSGMQSFDFLIRFNTTTGEMVVANSSALVSSLFSYRAYVNIPVSPGLVVVANAEVFKGTAPHSLLYNQSLIF
ncbi:MAG: hypothetical protein JRM88_06635 [Nitrososphaerota archaeon]|nr:hypothetical protein [Nitrososphaerota archaeon]